MMRRATVVFDNSEQLTRGGHVMPSSTYHWRGPGWYALQAEDYEWVKVSSHSKERGFTVEEAERTDYIGSPSYIGSFGELEEDS